MSNAHKQLRKNYEDLVAAAYGSHNPDAPLPLCVEAMKTNPLQHYLEAEMVERLGFENETFVSGSFTIYNPDGSIVEEKPRGRNGKFRKTVVIHADDSDEERKGDSELERG